MSMNYRDDCRFHKRLRILRGFDAGQHYRSVCRVQTVVSLPLVINGPSLIVLQYIKMRRGLARSSAHPHQESTKTLDIYQSLPQAATSTSPTSPQGRWFTFLYKNPIMCQRQTIAHACGHRRVNHTIIQCLAMKALGPGHRCFVLQLPIVRSTEKCSMCKRKS